MKPKILDIYINRFLLPHLVALFVFFICIKKSESYVLVTKVTLLLLKTQTNHFKQWLLQKMLINEILIKSNAIS
jgi:nucleoside recognition membrane protein YjiH